jgi:hypothetical protein
MAIVKEKYAGAKINLLHQLLQSDYEDGRPREYDICVDDLKVVRRTTDPEKFFSHEDFINADTRHLTITLYEGGSKRNTRYVYYLKEGDEEKATLSGIENTMNEKLLQQRQQWDFEQLQKENQDLKEELEEQEEYMEKLESMLQEEKQKKASIKDNWGEIFSVALEGIARRNVHLLNNIPLVGQGLAGVVEQDNKRMETSFETGQTQAQGSKSSFEKVGKEESPLSEEEQKILAYHRRLHETFSSEELLMIFKIIGLFSEDKANIHEVYTWLQDEEDTTEEKPAA